jgi:hypothetical protein
VNIPRFPGVIDSMYIAGEGDPTCHVDRVLALDDGGSVRERGLDVNPGRHDAVTSETEDLPGGNTWRRTKPVVCFRN